MPSRIQRSRAKGWRMPEGAIYVGRPTIWGNPWRVIDGVIVWIGREHDRGVGPTALPASIRGALSLDQALVELYRLSIRQWPSYRQHQITELLRGADLCCWCPLTYPDGRRYPCHADVLLELANGR